MTVYSVDKLMAQARRLAVDYRNATGKTLALSAEIARHDACSILDLDPVDQPDAGHDAIGREGALQGLRLQVKGRAIFDDNRSGHRLGQLKFNQEWDGVVLLLMDAEFEPNEIYFADRDAIQAAMDDPSASKRLSRGALSVARFKIIGEMVWNRQQGLLDDNDWSNRKTV